MQPRELGPYATSIAERLVPILAAPAGSMPRSIIENRQAHICMVFDLVHTYLQFNLHALSVSEASISLGCLRGSAIRLESSPIGGQASLEAVMSSRPWA